MTKSQKRIGQRPISGVFINDGAMNIATGMEIEQKSMLITRDNLKNLKVNGTVPISFSS